MRDQRRAPRGVRAQIAVHLVPDHPVGADGVEHGQEADVVGLLADAPVVARVLLGQTHGRRGPAGLHAERWRRAAVVDGEWAPDGFGFAAAHGVHEGMRVGAVQPWNVEPGVALPHSAAGLAPRELGDFVDELVVVACVARVDLPVPDVFELGMSQGEILDGEPLCVVDTGDISNRYKCQPGTEMPTP